MALVAATLGSDLAGLSPTDNAAQAALDLTDYLVNYFGGASVLGIPANPGVIGGAPKSALHGAMAPGLNTANGAATAIAAGWQAFWGALTGQEAAIWAIPPPNVIVPASLVPPAGLGSLATALQSTFDANVNGGLSLAQAALAIANTIHAASLGAIVTIQPPTPAPPFPSPIL